jgi:integrase
MKGTEMKVSEWAETVWTILNVRPKTLYDYQRLYIKHIDPVIGQSTLDSIDLVSLQRKLIELPPQTSRHTLMVLKVFWREAIKYGITNTNSIENLKAPTIQFKEKKFLTWSEVDALDWGRYNNQIRFLALHGLRWSEAAVISESDIRDGFVWISKSVYGEVKSKTSVRKVPYLGYWEPFPKTYKPMRLAANKHGVTVHSFRRTYAYLLKTQGIHVTTAQRLLGHSDPMMTLKIYTSVLDNEVEDAGIVLRSSIQKAV